MSDLHQAHIALGSNIDDRHAHLTRALELVNLIPTTTVDKVSPIVETPPLDPPDDPAFTRDPGGPFLNAVARLSTSRDPRALLDSLRRVESQLGRDHNAPRYAPRTIDLDLLLFGRLILQEPALTVPHPGLVSRAFVLFPLAQIDPDLPIPPTSRRAADLWEDLHNSGVPEPRAYPGV